MANTSEENSSTNSSRHANSSRHGDLKSAAATDKSTSGCIFETSNPHFSGAGLFTMHTSLFWTAKSPALKSKQLVHAWYKFCMKHQNRRRNRKHVGGHQNIDGTNLNSPSPHLSKQSTLPKVVNLPSLAQETRQKVAWGRRLDNNVQETLCTCDCVLTLSVFKTWNPNLI